MSIRWPVSVLAALMTAAFSVVVLSSPSKAETVGPTGFTALKSSAGPRLPAGSRALGRLAPSTELRVDVTLKVPDPQAVASFLSSLSDRGSPNYRRFLRPGEFARLFGPPPSEVGAVESALRSAGLHPGKVSSNHLMIPVAATAGTLDRAFHVLLQSYELPGGRDGFTSLSSPSISTAVFPDVEGVLGLNNLIQAHSLLARTTTSNSVEPRSRRLAGSSSGPRPCDAAIGAAEKYGSLTADRFASYYGLTPLYALGDLGQGTRVALAEFESNLPGDINAYKACYGVHTTVNYIDADSPGPAPGPGSGEAALDIENIIGLAPRVTIDVYRGVSTPGTSDIYNVYSAIVTRDTDQIIATGWGLCELDVESASGGTAFLTSEQTLLQQAAMQGQTVFAAAGDSGSSDCYGDTTSNANLPSVDDPASQPYVIGVGGTSIGASSETVWNDSSTNQGGAGGGGVSAVECMPDYQLQSTTTGETIPQGVVNSDSVKSATCSTGYRREVPDVSADADPDTGYVIYWTPDTAGATGSWLGGLGGTSAAAPLWAAVAALIDASPFCSYYGSTDRSSGGMLPNDATGLLYNSLYYIAASPYYSFALYDVTHGNNYFTPAGTTDNPDELYPATAGYDMASGLGTPSVAYADNFVPGLAALVCGLTATKLTTTGITRLTPDLGPSTHATRVTVSGSGFLPIKGADELKIGSKYVPLACKTSTSCTATIPPTKAGTDDLRVLVEGLTISPVGVPDRFTFAGVPTITRVRPLAGPAKAGEIVTVHGTGFLGTVKVRFGQRRATHLHVYSPSRLTVWAPAGSGVVYVHVSALGGSSKQTPVGIYHYEPVSTKARTAS
jgi:subtilase family serine protease